MSWLTEGPLAGLLHRGSDDTSGTGASRGGPFSGRGPVQRAVGALGDWLSNRFQGDDVGAMSTTQAGNAGAELDARTGWDPYSGAQTDVGPPAQGTLGQINPGSSAQGSSSPAWYDDTTMGADDPMGLVPDYGQDGAAAGNGGGDGPDWREGAAANYAGSISQFSPGETVITGRDDRWYQPKPGNRSR